MIILSIILIITGLLFIYKTSLLIRICEFIKQHFVNERIIILYGKKIGLFLILLGAIFISSEIRKKTGYNSLYVVYKKYYSKDFTAAEKLCLEMLSKEPKNAEVWMLLAKTYFAAGKYPQAKACFKRVVEIDNSKYKEVNHYLSLIDTKITK